MGSEYSPSCRFPVTAWTVVQHYKNLPGDRRVAALNEFIGRYWKPVFYFIRARRRSVQDAEDLTQDFLVRVLEKDLIAKADRERGRFRNFLLHNLQWFLSDQRQERVRRQEAFEKECIPVAGLLRDEDRNFEPTSNETPEGVFMKKWARGLVQRAVEQAEKRCKDEGKPAWWYDAFVAARSDDSPSQENLAQECGQTRDQVRYALSKMESYVGEELREELADHVDSSTEVEDEVRELFAILSWRTERPLA